MPMPFKNRDLQGRGGRGTSEGNIGAGLTFFSINLVVIQMYIEVALF